VRVVIDAADLDGEVDSDDVNNPASRSLLVCTERGSK